MATADAPPALDVKQQREASPDEEDNFFNSDLFLNTECAALPSLHAALHVLAPKSEMV